MQTFDHVSDGISRTPLAPVAVVKDGAQIHWFSPAVLVIFDDPMVAVYVRRGEGEAVQFVLKGSVGLGDTDA